MELVQMSTTCSELAMAETIAQSLVQARLAACVQVTGPVFSTYRWEGKVESAEEFMCLIKTRAALTSNVEAAIRSLHPYENPEIIVVPITGGSPDYLRWIETETAPTPAD